jgi:hypothetical protein
MWGFFIMSKDIPFIFNLLVVLITESWYILLNSFPHLLKSCFLSPLLLIFCIMIFDFHMLNQPFIPGRNLSHLIDLNNLFSMLLISSMLLSTLHLYSTRMLACKFFFFFICPDLALASKQHQHDRMYLKKLHYFQVFE